MHIFMQIGNPVNLQRIKYHKNQHFLRNSGYDVDFQEVSKSLNYSMENCDLYLICVKALDKSIDSIQHVP